MIDAVNIWHHYGVQPVLRDITLHVPRGQICALMGPNGRGKSTLMNVIAGIASPIEGYVKIDGLRRRADEETEIAIRRKVAYLGAEPWTPAFRSGREWLLAVGRIYDVADRRLLAHVDRLLDLLDLTQQADTLIAAYSTGQRKKIALSAALVTEAPVMLLDEPFAGGIDPAGILALRRVLRGLAEQESVTILMATPVPELVEEVADRVTIISDGQITIDETVAQFRARAGGTLAEAYEQIVSPGIREKVTRYLAAESETNE